MEFAVDLVVAAAAEDLESGSFARLQGYSLAAGFGGVKGQGTTHSTEELLVHPPWL
jgi:hypothetical protein